MLKEFKEFAFKGNLIDMAVGIIIGGAFGTVVKSLVNNVFMPPLGQIMAGIDFTKMKVVLQDEVKEVKNEAGEVTTAGVAEVAINYGQFITDLIAFVLMAFAVFIVVKKVLASMKKEEEAKPAEPPKQEVLLEEIRDVLKEKP